MSEDTRSTYKDRKSKEKIAWITGICMIIAAVIGTLSVSINVNTENEKLKKDYEEVISENTDLSNQTNEAQEAYNSLNTQYESLVSQNNDLQDRIISLEDELSQYPSIIEENASLKKDLEDLQDEVKNLKEKYENQENTSSIENNGENQPSPTSSGRKVSIFDLDTFKGDGFWFDLSYTTFSEEDFIDTYGNEYLNARIGNHGATDRFATFTPTYLLDKKYSICEGQIAWSKTYKNYEGSAWVEFYSGDEYIYITDKITADSKLLTFSFSVKAVEKLTIVKNGTSSSHSVEIIYPYLNLVE